MEVVLGNASMTFFISLILIVQRKHNAVALLLLLALVVVQLLLDVAVHPLRLQRRRPAIRQIAIVFVGLLQRLRLRRLRQRAARRRLRRLRQLQQRRRPLWILARTTVFGIALPVLILGI